MTLLQLRTKVRRKVQDVAEVQWTDAEIDESINQSYYDVQAEVHIVNPEATVTFDTMDATSGTHWYPMPPSFGLISVGLKAAAADNYTKLGFKLYEDILNLDGETNFYTRKGEWLGIFPAPSVTLTDGIELQHKAINTLTVDSDEPRLKLPLHNALVLGAKIDLLGDTNEDSQADKDRYQGIIKRLGMWYNMDVDQAESFSPRGL